MIELIEHTINKIDNLIKEQLPESKYQFELYDLATNTKHFRGFDEQFQWGSVYKLFVVAEIIKMAEEGLLNLENGINLNKELYVNGNGIAKHLTHLEKLTYIDACKMVMAASDNLCADELLHIVGFIRINTLFINAGCLNSKLSYDLNEVVTNLFNELPKNCNSSYYHSKEFFEYFKIKLENNLKENYTNANDINTCFNYILHNYLKPDFSRILLELVLVPNVHTRIAAYTFFSKFLLRGKTGALGFGIVNNETAAVIEKNTQSVKAFFSINTKSNSVRNFLSNDTIGLIGLEIANLYEQIYYNN